MKPKITVSYTPCILSDGTEIMQKTVTTIYDPDTLLDKIMPRLGIISAICLAIGCIGAVILKAVQLC